jgi:hypothetical protein
LQDVLLGFLGFGLAVYILLAYYVIFKHGFSRGVLSLLIPIVFFYHLIVLRRELRGGPVLLGAVMGAAVVFAMLASERNPGSEPTPLPPEPSAPDRYSKANPGESVERDRGNAKGNQTEKTKPVRRRSTRSPGR